MMFCEVQRRLDEKLQELLGQQSEIRKGFYETQENQTTNSKNWTDIRKYWNFNLHKLLNVISKLYERGCVLRKNNKKMEEKQFEP